VQKAPECLNYYYFYQMVTLPMTLGAPQAPQTKTFSAFSTAIHSFVTGESRDFKFGTVTYHGKSHPADKKIFSEKIVVWVT